MPQVHKTLHLWTVYLNLKYLIVFLVFWLMNNIYQSHNMMIGVLLAIRYFRQ